MTGIWLTAGMLAKIIHLSIFNFKKRDLYMIPVALAAGLVTMGEIADDYVAGDFLEPWFGLPIGFALVAVFAFKDRLLPVITEGTLFGYSLIAGYLFFSDTYLNGTEVGIWSLLPMTLTLGVAIFLIVYPERVGKVIQTILMTLFMCISIYIGYELSKDTLSFDGSNWELIVIGYSYMVLVANVMYIIYFIPLQGENQSLKNRMQKIREHAKDLEEKYVAVNSTLKQILLTTIFFLVMILFDHLNYISNALLVSITLSFMMLVHTPPEKSKFAPTSVYESL